MDLRSFILTRDESVIRVLKMLLSDLEISVENAPKTDIAVQTLNKTRFDGLFIDCDVEGASELLKNIRDSSLHKRAVVFAILSDVMTVGTAFGLGANFVLYKPVTVARTRRSLKAAHGLMMRERRGHHRHSLAAHAYLTFAEGTALKVKVVDVSLGGLAVQTAKALTADQELHVRFPMPGGEPAIRAQGRIAWADRSGTAGIQFVSFSEDSQRHLEKWLLARAVVSGDGEVVSSAEPLEVPAFVAAEEMAGETKLQEEVEVEVVASYAEPQETSPRQFHRDVLLRGEYRAAIVAVTIRGGRSYVARGYCTDFSTQGLGIELEDGELVIGDAVLLELSLPHARGAISLHGRVRHRHESHYGLELVSLSSDDRRTIKRAIAELPAKE